MKAWSPQPQRQRRNADANALLFFAGTPYGLWSRPLVPIGGPAPESKSAHRRHEARPTCGGVIESGLRSMKPIDMPPFEDTAPLPAGAGLERGWYLWLTAATVGAVAIAGLADAFAGFL